MCKINGKLYWQIQARHMLLAWNSRYGDHTILSYLLSIAFICQVSRIHSGEWKFVMVSGMQRLATMCNHTYAIMLNQCHPVPDIELHPHWVFAWHTGGPKKTGPLYSVAYNFSNSFQIYIIFVEKQPLCSLKHGRVENKPSLFFTESDVTCTSILKLKGTEECGPTFNGHTVDVNWL